MELRKEQGGVNKYEENNEHLNKTIRILQNKLEQSLKKFNTTLVENRKNREKLDYYRKERNVFYNIVNKLIKDIKEKKNHINSMIESSTSAYQTRDEANCKISILKEKSEKEFYQHSQEINELSRLLAHEQKTRDFINTKNAERKIVASKAKNKKNVNQDDENHIIETYQKAFDQIYKSTKMNDINELIASFNETEEENFSLFNYVTEVIGEVGELNKEIKDVSQNIEKLKIQNIEIEDKKKVTISKLEEKLNEVKEKSKQYENDYIDCNRNLNVLKEKVLEIMKIIQTFKPVKKIFIPPEIPNKHFSSDAENQENDAKHEENGNKENEVKREKADAKSDENESKKAENDQNEQDKNFKDDIDTVRFELPVNLELKDEIKDVNLMQCLNYIENNINNLLMINYTINLSNIINTNQQSQRNNMVDSNTISNKIETETAISNENSLLPNSQDINSLLGVGPQPQVQYNNINVPILSDEFDIMQKSTVNKNALVVDKKNEKFNDSYPMSREELMKINAPSIKQQDEKNGSKAKINNDS